MTTLSATAARSRFFHVLKRASKAHVPFQITSRTGDVVIISKVHYDNLLETLEFLSTPGVLKGVREARQDIKAGRTKAMKDIFRSGVRRFTRSGLPAGLKKISKRSHLNFAPNSKTF